MHQPVKEKTGWIGKNIHDHREEEEYVDFENIKLNVKNVYKAMEKLPAGYRLYLNHRVRAQFLLRKFA